MQKAIWARAAAIAAAFALAACATPAKEAAPPAAPEAPGAIHPEIWPQAQSPMPDDPDIEAAISRLLPAMTVEEKVGQLVQADMNSVTPEDVRRYRLGSVLNGGNSGPGGNDRAPARDWLAMADAYYDASMQAPAGRPAIPVIWGSDAVHGNSNIIGATIFPHNIGLGAARNPELLKRIGEITALELRVVGGDWTFAPTIAVVRDDRWGRTYEGYSEEPTLVTQYASAIIEGIQGRPGDPDFLRGSHVVSSAKHFLGDGGTDGGRDQGDNLYSEAQLRDLFAAPYPAAIAAGVQTVMTSYNSWHGQKSTGNRALLTDVLRGRMGFDGFVVDDWNAHGQVQGCTAVDCPAALDAGVDMFMAPDSWKGIYESTLAHARSGRLTQARLDEAVARILRVKLRAGLFQAGRPSSRQYAGQWNLLGAPAHRAVARQAARESLVLLKNEDAILPFNPRSRVLVAGDGANDMGKQTGGWTISWQGTGNSRADFPNGETIYEGIRARVRAAGGTATLSADGSFRGRKPDVAIVVFGENPYAEFQGDIATLDYQPDDARDLALIQRLRAQNIPVIAVFISGRPLYVTPEINASNAFVAAWLPGSEGGGVADLLFRSAANYDFRGKLSFSWPRAPDQSPLNVGDANYDPLFAFGYGMTYAEPRNLGLLPEAQASAADAVRIDRYFETGAPASGWKLSLYGPGASRDVETPSAAIPGLALTRVDRGVQEGALALRWDGAARSGVAIAGRQIDLSRQTNGDMTLVVDLRVDAAPSGSAVMGVGCGGDNCRGALEVGQLLRAAPVGEWTSLRVRLSCFARAGAQMGTVTTPFALESAGAMGVSISGVRLAPGEGAAVCPSAAAR
ncbi:MAG: exo 1,3/1,4-beta-D-glucan glucohydrolase [Hyphomonadaceae bacterium]|nr:exo 1,3/1,4-beta-D-glucan glucohydrolase [Hyphomonadaceae bacterium]